MCHWLVCERRWLGVFQGWGRCSDSRPDLKADLSLWDVLLCLSQPSGWVQFSSFLLGNFQEIRHISEEEFQSQQITLLKKRKKKKKVFCTETFLDSSIKHLRQERSAGDIDVQGSSSAGTAPRSSVSCIFMCKGRHPNTKTVSADVKLKRRSGFLQSEGVNRPPRKPKSPKWSLKIKCMLLNHRWLNAKLVEKLELRFRQI